MLSLLSRSLTTSARNGSIQRYFDTPSSELGLGLKRGSGVNRSGLFGYGRSESLSSDEWTRAAQETVSRASRLAQRISQSQSQSPLPLTKSVKMLDALSDQLCAVLDATELVLNVHPDKKVVQDAANGNALLTSFMNSLNTDVSLYNALKASIDAQQFIPQPPPSNQTKVVADLLMKDFQKSGIHLSGSQRAQFVKLSDDILNLGNKFSRASSSISRLAIIPTDDSSILSHILRYARDEDVRRLVYTAANQSSEEDVWTLEELLRKRMQLARVLGKKSYADMWLGDKMAQSPERVMQFLENVSNGNWDLAKQDIARLESIKKEFVKGVNGRAFYTQFLSPVGNVPAVSGDELKPYFSVGTTLQGISDLLGDLYGIRLEPVFDIADGETWHPDVRKVHVVHESEGVIGVVYMDLFMREKGVEVDKFDGAAQFTVRCSRRLDDYEQYCEEPRAGLRSPQTEVTRRTEEGTNGLYQLPIVVLVTQFERPTKETPALLSLNEVETLFHEMGHVIHSVLARTDYQHISGTRCALDFVEVPSNLLESFARDFGVLQSIGVHYRSGKQVPIDLIRGVKARQGMLEGLERQKQVKMAVLDQYYHSEQMDVANFDTTMVLRQVQSKFHVIPYVDGTQWQTQFSHLFSYGASYYSYFWARRVSDAIQARVFGAEKNSYLHQKDRLREGGEVVRNELLKWGGGRDPWIGLDKAGIDVEVLGRL
ncbi:zincin [Rhizoclosmatium globosum]|uniref:mitochondrial intermediate peptidase n=1 Tax=Rhizoclosmatium globosum TaxID=329046 RepID=A0A1Y2C328_9FUNG|nr:zincin [Rhizoclosmatium globosum]|eukprot:ORY41411.1 zincin [Rhizoclosmatium globosum]